MLAPQACVAVEIAGPPAAEEHRAALERRCSEILGARRCRIVLSSAAPAPADADCWQAHVTTGGGDPPVEASVVLSDDSEPSHAPVRRDITFRPNDVVAERWATLGLVIAALVTVEEHSAAEELPAPALAPGGAGFTPVVVAPAPVPSVPLDGEVRVAGVGALGVLPSAALGARVEASLAREHVVGLVRGTLFPGDTRANLGAHGAGGDVEQASAGLGVGARAVSGPWLLRACVGGDVARMRARGVGVAETNSATAWWGAVWAGVSGELRVATHLAFTVDVEGAVALQRPSFAIFGTSTVFSPAPVGGVAALGVAVPF